MNYSDKLYIKELSQPKSTLQQRVDFLIKCALKNTLPMKMNQIIHTFGVDIIGNDRYSYEEVIDHTDIMKFLEMAYSEFGMPITPNELSFRTTLMYHLSAHISSPYEYEVEDNLAEALQETELRGLTTDDLKLPYDSIHIKVPKSLNFKVYNTESGWHDLESLYIVEDPLYTMDNTIIRAWRFLLIGSVKGYVKLKNGDEYADDAVSFFRVPLKSGMSVDEAMNTLDYHIEENNNMHNMKIVWKDPFKWVMNAVMYATNVDCGKVMLNKEAMRLKNRMFKITPKSKNYARLKERYKKICRNTCIMLGKDFKEKDTEIQHRTMTVRSKVPGHWRRVVHGKERLERTWKWINSYWKGPQDGLFDNRPHRIV
jgi:hypothetical protein